MRGRCKDSVCHAKTLCTLKWWTTKGEFLACVNTAQSMIAGRVDNTDETSTSPGDVLAAASSGSSASETEFTTNDVFMAIGATAAATVIAVACIATTVYILRRTDVLKNRSQYDTVATL